ncbi:hypothetical protein COS55_03875 [Candidatus Shapirobacteria bacterium CG03_land_8_20_14_0_80_40_19]|uniref:Uncharacterized protein n=4 Tax=Candidatus Shapironibacteriota TaxID=1752721 RepID=A0A2M7BB03_9BACT|nr:MAG: hypothetical protein COV89_02585 [Candidatus Shapirobacteria bacterium CG11_big_fil_rev_8_21_14_0_20_40_12]PIV00308.1 MAG: hypothetical protein COS55_03875 [Candidatus Shapirobacteria bacterium CG03_land_8_20_14_0_80_40_19]PJC28760.1 MAG: hypothetical protein CO053_02880 [Candidatus Shapirobacteria bacterium CG_4_9_14_0_2_um_filter_40_11]PJC76070.1 MAG: hypothetical protein CO010_03620 [Candidatus Shapirobacteria bacterium CG_4_8_14_3_um_filter_39_11]
MLTKDDLNKIQLLIVAGSSQVLKEIDEVKDQIREVKDSINLIPTKEEHFNSMDELMGEVKKVREEQEVIGDTLFQHNNRLEKLETKIGITSPY